jgi:3-deoxy-D-manno-octulosonic-acid transferase
MRPVLEELIQLRPDLNWLVTSNTGTGIDMVNSWHLSRVSTKLAPMDLGWVVRGLIRRWSIKAHITLEAELWPHRFLLCPGPVILLGGRMSAGTAKTWAKLPHLAQRVLRSIYFASAQDGASLGRMLDLGLPSAAARDVVDLKAFYTAPGLIPDDRMKEHLPRDKTWLAASTHPGDELFALEAHKKLLQNDPEAKLIIAPRHPRRADEIIALLRTSGLSYAQRSKGETPKAQVYLADTMGEMALWYALSGRVFIGGTLSDRGGHTPYEPAAFEAALLHGPDVRNFQASFGRLSSAGASVRVDSAENLAKALDDLSHRSAQQDLGARAAHALEQDIELEDLVRQLLGVLPRR